MLCLTVELFFIILKNYVVISLVFHVLKNWLKCFQPKDFNSSSLPFDNTIFLLLSLVKYPIGLISILFFLINSYSLGVIENNNSYSSPPFNAQFEKFKSNSFATNFVSSNSSCT